MSLQKFRADSSKPQPDGAVKWYADWVGGPSLSKIANCRVDGYGKRVTVYITGEADTWFSMPAATRICGRYLGGYVTGDSDTGENLIFHALDKFKDRL